ncbi:MAG: FAD-binding oxidoreductase [Clostridia bacterium]
MTRDFEVIVIGAGIVGASIAYYLSKLGSKVLVLEKEEVAAGASGGNMGQISIADREVGTELSWALASLKLYKEYEQKGELQTDIARTGGLFLFYEDEELAGAEASISEHIKLGLDIRVLRGKEILQQQPLLNLDTLKGAIYTADEGSLNPLTVTFGLMERAIAYGAELIKGAEVREFVLKEGRITGVKSTVGEFTANQVVVATGAWTRELMSKLGLDYKIFYNRASVMITQAVPSCISGPIETGGFVTGDLKTEKWTLLSVMQHKNGTIGIGQDTSTSANYNKDLTYEGVVDMAKLFVEHFPTLADIEILRIWSAVTPYVEDHKPLFGYSGRYPNLFLAAGLKGAFTIAPEAGKTAASILLTGTSSYDCSAYSPSRFEY